MADIHWLNPVSADFNTVADWSTGTVPGASDDVFLDAPGSTAYTVTASTDENVNSLRLADTATLAIAVPFGVVVISATGGCSNAGTIAIGNTSVLSIFGGQIVNSGTIALEGATGGGAGLVFHANATLIGGGTISLSDSAGNGISQTGKFLTNIDNTIVGSGLVHGAANLTIVNEAGGVIDADNKTPLTIKLGSLDNTGLIETTGKGHCTIKAALDNTGVLEANGGKIAVKGAVSGSGSAVISAGTIDFQDVFTQNVSFTGRAGELELAESQSYNASITGFALTGRTSLDLGDIGFVSSTEATFSGTATSGVLTVTDGSHSAIIHLTGNYIAAGFIASSDGNGGTIVVGSSTPPSAPAHRFIAAAAGLGGSAGESIHAGARLADPAPVLARPHAMIA